jgi:hypothetical protein
MPRPLDQYNNWGGGEEKQKSYRDEAVRKFETLKAMGETLISVQNAPEKGKWFVRNVQMGEEQSPHHTQLSDLVVSFEFYVQTSGFLITSPDGQTYEVFGDYKNGAIGATTFATWFAWAVENTEIMDQILTVLGMEAHEKKHDPKARYTPPQGSSEETLRIFNLLKSVTDSIRAEQKANYITRDKRAIMNFVEAMQAGDKKTAKNILEGRSGYVLGQVYDTRAKALRDGWEATVEKLAEDSVEDMQNQFVYKNTRKLASIASAKGNMNEPKVISITANGGIIESALDFSFEDGSSFRVDQSVVISRSVHGNLFYRFPTTFHDVKMPGGVKMGMPSEERMNEIFAKA